MMRRFIWVAMVFGLLAAMPAMAVDSGPYMGLALGGATTERDISGVKFDQNDVAWKFYGGFHFLQFFAVETAYRSFGSPEKNGIQVETTGFDVSGLAGLPLGPVFVYGRGGLMFWNADIKHLLDGKSSVDGNDFTGGIGVSLDVAKIRLRGEVEYFNIADGALMYTVGAAWLF